MEGLDEYRFAGRNGDVRLAAAEVVSDRSHFQMRKFRLDGEHLRRRGRNGERPGEFEYEYLAHGFGTSAKRIVVYGLWPPGIPVFRREGAFLDAYPFLYDELPRREFSCVENGRLGFAGSAFGLHKLSTTEER